MGMETQEINMTMLRKKVVEARKVFYVSAEFAPFSGRKDPFP